MTGKSALRAWNSFPEVAPIFIIISMPGFELKTGVSERLGLQYSCIRQEVNKQMLANYERNFTQLKTGLIICH